MEIWLGYTVEPLLTATSVIRSLRYYSLDCGLCMDCGYDMEVSLFGIPAHRVHQKRDYANRTQQQ